LKRYFVLRKITFGSEILTCIKTISPEGNNNGLRKRFVALGKVWVVML